MKQPHALSEALDQRVQRNLFDVSLPYWAGILTTPLSTLEIIWKCAYLATALKRRVIPGCTTDSHLVPEKANLVARLAEILELSLHSPKKPCGAEKWSTRTPQVCANDPCCPPGCLLWFVLGLRNHMAISHKVAKVIKATPEPPSLHPPHLYHSSRFAPNLGSDPTFSKISIQLRLHQRMPRKEA